MVKEVKEVEPGDIFVLDALRVESVMTEGGSTYISWKGDRRSMDVVGADEEAPDVIHWRCRGCGLPIVDEDWEPL